MGIKISPIGTTTITNLPSGADTQIQFNDGGSFGGDAALVWDKTTNQLTINPDTAIGTDTTGVELNIAADGNAAVGIWSASATAGAGGNVGFYRARGTNASPTPVDNNDSLGLIGFNGYVDGGGSPDYYASSASIDARISGTPGTDITPTRLIITNMDASGNNHTSSLETSGAWLMEIGQLTAVAFADLPGTPQAGMYAYISNSSTQVWGATIAAASPGSPVLGWYNGTNWTVFGK